MSFCANQRPAVLVADTDSFEFGADSSCYRRLENSLRRGVVFYAWPEAARRGFELEAAWLELYSSVPKLLASIDNTVDRVFEDIMAMAVQAHRREIPFIWFWPGAWESCYIMTHDVEQESGRAFCLELLRLNDEYGITTSPQIVPEGR